MEKPPLAVHAVASFRYAWFALEIGYFREESVKGKEAVTVMQANLFQPCES